MAIHSRPLVVAKIAVNIGAFLAIALAVAGPAVATSSESSGAVPSIPGATYQGCYIDNTTPSSRSLPVGTISGATNEVCITTCSAKGFPIAGTEYGGECYCGANLAGITQAPDSDCSMSCTSNPDETCGGPARLTVFKNDTIDAFVPKVPIISCTTYIGCWVDTVNPRTFPVFQNSNATDYDCVAQCQANGYRFAGTENFSQCFCSGSAPSTTKVDDAICRDPCEGDRFEICGGGALMTVYETTGCSAPTSSPPASSPPSSPTPDTSSMSSTAPPPTSSPSTFNETSIPPSTASTTPTSSIQSTVACFVYHDKITTATSTKSSATPTPTFSCPSKWKGYCHQGTKGW
ncbi:WSC domain-containing protein [Zopfochytrium polystomum]|nr:WSC domain-containing protein [Zopfochytrium polystomum]